MHVFARTEKQTYGRLGDFVTVSLVLLNNRPALPSPTAALRPHSSPAVEPRTRMRCGSPVGRRAAPACWRGALYPLCRCSRWRSRAVLRRYNLPKAGGGVVVRGKKTRAAWVALCFWLALDGKGEIPVKGKITVGKLPENVLARLPGALPKSLASFCRCNPL